MININLVLPLIDIELEDCVGNECEKNEPLKECLDYKVNYECKIFNTTSSFSYL